MEKLSYSSMILNIGNREWWVFYPLKLAITSPTSGGRSVDIVRSRTQTMEFSFFFREWWVVSFTFRKIHPQGRSHLYLRDRRFGRAGCCGEEKSLTLPAKSTPAAKPVAHLHTHWCIFLNKWTKIVFPDMEHQRRCEPSTGGYNPSEIPCRVIRALQMLRARQVSALMPVYTQSIEISPILPTFRYVSASHKP
jgi:hypothetical protein